MTYALIAALILMTVVAVVFYFNIQFHKQDADRNLSLFDEAQARLSKAWEAVYDLPHDAGTGLGTLLLRHKAEALKNRNTIIEMQNAVNKAEATNPESVRLVKELDKILFRA